MLTGHSLSAVIAQSCSLSYPCLCRAAQELYCTRVESATTSHTDPHPFLCTWMGTCLPFILVAMQASMPSAERHRSLRLHWGPLQPCSWLAPLQSSRKNARPWQEKTLAGPEMRAFNGNPETHVAWQGVLLLTCWSRSVRWGACCLSLAHTVALH